MRVSRLTKDMVLMRLVKDRESYEGENKGRKGISENIAYEFCHCEPLDEAKQSLTPPTCHCEATKWTWQSLIPVSHCEPLDEAKQSLSKASGLEITSSLALLAMT